MKRKTGFTKRELRLLAAKAEEQHERMRGARFYRRLDFFIYLLAVVTVALAVRSFVFEPIRVDGSSMIPTLVHGERMLVEKIGYWFDSPGRGDIVICYYPGYTESCVKRVIGLPGETVSIENGGVYIDGAPLDEQAYWTGEITGALAPVQIGEKELFVMGDNRNGSKDSRDSSVGCIPYEKLVGRVRAVIWPLGNFVRFEDVEYSYGS